MSEKKIVFLFLGLFLLSVIAMLLSHYVEIEAWGEFSSVFFRLIALIFVIAFLILGGLFFTYNRN